jgi:hypothetical protein
MRIKVLNVDVESKGEGAKQYEIAEILYDFNGNKQNFKLVSFSNPSGFKLIKDAKKGDEFDVTVEKKGQYNQWVSVSPAGSSPPAATSTSSAVSKPSNYGKDFETREERAARQVLIVKQSSLSAAVATLTPGAKKELDPADVIALAEKYTAWVFENKADDIFSDEFPQDIPV